MSIMQTLIDAKNTALRPYFAFRSWKPIWKMLNREGRQSFHAAAAVRTEAESAVIRDLAADGIAITHLDDLFPGRDLLAQMQAAARTLESSAVPNQKKTFLTQIIPLYPVLDLDDLFVKFALSDEILNCVSSYLEMWPKLYYYTLGITNPVEAGAVPRQSQRWHRDPEDRKMCKVFVYLNDVDAAAGPFMYVKRTARGLAWESVYPQRPPHGRYPPDGEVERLIPAENIKVCTGRAGTVVFADTSGLHKGGYATGGRRIMSTTGFVTKACPRGVFYSRGPNFDQKNEVLSPRAQYALRNTKIANRKLKY